MKVPNWILVVVGAGWTALAIADAWVWHQASVTGALVQLTVAGLFIAVAWHRRGSGWT